MDQQKTWSQKIQKKMSFGFKRDGNKQKGYFERKIQNMAVRKSKKSLPTEAQKVQEQVNYDRLRDMMRVKDER